MDWFYNAKGLRTGPVSDDELRKLYARGEIYPDTLIWKSDFGTEWRRLDTISDVYAGPKDSPPPLPMTAIGDQWAWVMALTPLFLGLVDLWLQESTSQPLDIATFSIANLIICLTCIAMDNGVVAQAGAGNRIRGVAVWIILTPAAYLFVRAKRLEKNQYTLFAWLGSFLFATYVSANAF
jgi:hypothetical protein